MESNQFPKYPQELENDIGTLSEYLFEKYNDIFDVFYLEECDKNTFDKSYSKCDLVDEYEMRLLKICNQLRFTK
jgi:hypothetical protein